MSIKDSLLNFFTVHRKGMFIYAFLFWGIPVVVLILKGINSLPADIDFRLLKILLAFIAGVLFYFAVFVRIMKKYLKHIYELATPVYFWKTFKIRAYIMIVLMIALGITLRKTGIVELQYLSLFYFTMATPLLISSVRFLLHAKRQFAK